MASMEERNRRMSSKHSIHSQPNGIMRYRTDQRPISTSSAKHNMFAGPTASKKLQQSVNTKLAARLSLWYASKIRSKNSSRRASPLQDFRWLECQDVFVLTRPCRA